MKHWLRTGSAHKFITSPTILSRYNRIPRPIMSTSVLCQYGRFCSYMQFGGGSQAWQGYPLHGAKIWEIHKYHPHKNFGQRPGPGGGISFISPPGQIPGAKTLNITPSGLKARGGGGGVEIMYTYSTPSCRRVWRGYRIPWAEFFQNACMVLIAM